MAAPSTPTNFFVTTGNGQIFTQWDLVSGATSYDVQRSTDGVTYASVDTPSTPYFLDDTVSLNTQYYYQIAAVNSDGTSEYTDPQSAIPVVNGEMSLAMLRYLSKCKADRVNSNFVTLPEWNANINQSYTELYDLLTTAFEDYFLAPVARFTTDGRASGIYPLPDGSTSFTAADGSTFVPDPLFKLQGVDLGVNTANNAWVSVKKFNFYNRNQFIYPNSASTLYGVFNLRYRAMDSNIHFIPAPTNGQIIQLWYIPRMTMLLKDTDSTIAGINGWTEFIIIDAAIKALQKEESDVTTLMVQRAGIVERIKTTAQNRDVGQPDTITDVSRNEWNFNMPFDGFKGGW